MHLVVRARPDQVGPGRLAGRRVKPRLREPDGRAILPRRHQRVGELFVGLRDREANAGRACLDAPDRLGKIGKPQSGVGQLDPKAIACAIEHALRDPLGRDRAHGRRCIKPIDELAVGRERRVIALQQRLDLGKRQQRLGRRLAQAEPAHGVIVAIAGLFGPILELVDPPQEHLHPGVGLVAGRAAGLGDAQVLPRRLHRAEFQIRPPEQRVQLGEHLGLLAHESRHRAQDGVDGLLGVALAEQHLTLPPDRPDAHVLWQLGVGEHAAQPAEHALVIRVAPSKLPLDHALVELVAEVTPGVGQAVGPSDGGVELVELRQRCAEEERVGRLDPRLGPLRVAVLGDDVPPVLLAADPELLLAEIDRACQQQVVGLQRRAHERLALDVGVDVGVERLDRRGVLLGGDLRLGATHETGDVRIGLGRERDHDADDHQRKPANQRGHLPELAPTARPLRGLPGRLLGRVALGWWLRFVAHARVLRWSRRRQQRARVALRRAVGR